LEYCVRFATELNKKNTKALWIGASSKNKIEPKCPKDPIKFLGTYLSHDAAANNNNNSYVKIRKMEMKLNIWRSRDLKNYASKISKSVSINLYCPHAFCSRNSDTTNPKQTVCFSMEE